MATLRALNIARIVARRNLSSSHLRTAQKEFDDAKLREIIETSGLGKPLPKVRVLKASDQTPGVGITMKNFQDFNVLKDEESSEKKALNGINTVPERVSGVSGVSGVNGVPKGPNERSLLEEIQNIQTQDAFTEKLSKWVSEMISNIQPSLKIVTSTLNDVTGYTSIEKQKSSVQSVESEIRQARRTVKLAKKNYADAIEVRADVQKEINELLTRKHNWTPQDVERFTQLYRSDHQNQMDEINAKQALEEAEQAVDGVQLKLTYLILTRYHEEQLWSDKIRQALTWGTWMLTGVNILLFATATFLVEPWKRKRLVSAFHDEMQLKLDEYTAEMKVLSAMINHSGSENEYLENLAFSSNSPVSLTSLEDFPNSGLLHFPLISGQILGSWTKLRLWLNNFFGLFQNPRSSLMMETSDLAIVSGFFVVVGWGFGSAFTMLLK